MLSTIYHSLIASYGHHKEQLNLNIIRYNFLVKTKKVQTFLYWENWKLKHCSILQRHTKCTTWSNVSHMLRTHIYKNQACQNYTNENENTWMQTSIFSNAYCSHFGKLCKYVSVTFYRDPTGHSLYKYSGKYLNNNILVRKWAHTSQTEQGMVTDFLYNFTELLSSFNPNIHLFNFYIVQTTNRSTIWIQ